MPAKSFSYSLATAFASDAFGGNPAAILFVDNEDTFSNASNLLANISANFNQPMLSVLSPIRDSSQENVARFGIRWFTAVKTEMPLCGHGTLAAAGAILETPGLVDPSVTILEFETQFGVTISARKADDGRLEIVMPAGTLRPLNEDELMKVTPILEQSLGKDIVPVFVGTGVGSFQHFLYVELDPKVGLAGLKVATEPLKSSGYRAHVFTTSSPSSDYAFVSRMFGPNELPGTGEDHVCGAAHCLLTPYWVEKKSLYAEKSINARMVSERGGDLNVFWDEQAETVALRGHVRVFAKGEFHV